MIPDLTATRERLRQNTTTPTAELAHCVTQAQSAACQNVFLRPMFEEAQAQLGSSGLSDTPLGGLAFSVKDLFDIEGQTTPAGSRILRDAPPASSDCPAVARLKAAGGALIGRTNMVEFAFSGVGINPHYGTPAAWDGRYNQAPGPIPGLTSPKPAVARIPGGSSSGAAVSVATGAAFIGLGSDTGGSIRIPAALNGIVGFKSTARLVPTEGAIPLSTTLDTVCAMTRTVRDAVLAHEILSQRSVQRQPRRLNGVRLAVAEHTMLDGLDQTNHRAFDRALQRLSQAGAQIVNVRLSELGALRDMQTTGGFSAAESYFWHRPLLNRGPSARASYDPRVLARIERGAHMAAFEYMELVTARERWIASMTAALRGYEAVLSPTVPIVAPPLANLGPDTAHDDAFFRTNALLLRNPSVVNMLDGCALSLPSHAPDELPTGLMLWQGALHDDVILNLGLEIETLLQF